MATSNISDDDVVFVQEFRKAIEKTIETFPKIKRLKTVQEEALLSFIQRRDVLAVLPTGSGKSLIFQAVPGVVRFLNEKGFSYPENPIIVVVCPLNALIASHIKELENIGISACSLSDENLVEADVKAGKFSIVFTNPESIVENQKWRDMLQSSVYEKQLFGLVTDEAHVVPKWGKGNTKGRKAAFRQCFFRLGEVRSLLPLGSPVLALTATATAEVRRETIEGLALKPNTHEITISPDRLNIYLFKTKVNKKLDCFKWLLDILKKENIDSPRTIIYCKSQKQCGKLYRFFKMELGDSQYFPEDAKKISANSLIGMYHANTLEKHKERIANSLYHFDGCCRVVFATTALGMGVNLKDIRQVIHYGPPREADDFIQEMGRAGRDGKPAKSILFYTGGHLKNCSDTIKEYAKTKAFCLREILLREFDEKVQTEQFQSRHDCCITCHSKCQCQGSKCEVDLPNYVNISTEETPQRKTRQVTMQQKNELKELLIDFQKQLEANCPAYIMSSQATTGFSDSLVKSIIKNVKSIFTLEDLIELTPIYKKSQAIEVLFMIRDVFEDLTFDMDGQWEEEFNLNLDFNFEGDYGSDSDSYSVDSDSDESVTSNTSELSGVMEFTVDT